MVWYVFSIFSLYKTSLAGSIFFLPNLMREHLGARIHYISIHSWSASLPCDFSTVHGRPASCSYSSHPRCLSDIPEHFESWGMQQGWKWTCGNVPTERADRYLQWLGVEWREFSNDIAPLAESPLNALKLRGCTWYLPPHEVRPGPDNQPRLEIVEILWASILYTRFECTLPSS